MQGVRYGRSRQPTWADPLDLNLLSTPVVEDEMISENKKRGEVPQFASVGKSNELKARMNRHHCQDHQGEDDEEEITPVRDPEMYDFESQFFSDANPIDNIEDKNPDINRMIRSRLRRLEKNLAKVEAPDYNRLPIDEKRESETVQQSKTPGVAGKQKLFLKNVSSGFRTFISRPGKPKPDGEGPLRLNRLHSASNSSMSKLPSTIRREFLKMSTRPFTVYDGESHQSARHGLFIESKNSDSEQNLSEFDDEILRVPSAHEQNARVMSFMVPEEPSDDDDMQVSNTKPTNEYGEICSQTSDNEVQGTSSSYRLEAQEEFAYLVGSTQTGNTKPESLSSRPGTSPQLAQEKTADSSAIRDYSPSSSSATSLLRKRTELPLSILDLIQHYEGGQSRHSSDMYGSFGTPSPLLKLGTNYDLPGVRAMFESPQASHSGSVQNAAQRPSKWHGLGVRFKDTSPRKSSTREEDHSPPMSEVSPLSDRTEDEAVGTECLDKQATESTRGGVRFDKFVTGTSFVSNLTPSVSPTLTPTTKDTLGSRHRGALIVENQSASASAERRFNAAHNAHAGEPANLSRLFDAMDLPTEADRDSVHGDEVEHQVRASDTDAEDKQKFIPRQTMLTWAKAKSLVTPVGTEQKGVQGPGSRGRRETTEGRWRAQPETPPSPTPFENHALLYAVRLVSGNLVKRAGISSRDTAYSALLSDIWGQSQYATIATLAAKRQQDARCSSHRDGPRDKLSTGQLVELVREESDVVGRQSESLPEKHDCDASRDQLVRILRRVKYNELATNERRLTAKLVASEKNVDFDSVRRLWDVPQVVFEASGVFEFLRDECDAEAICAFYDRYLWRRQPDSRIFNILFWKESRVAKEENKTEKIIGIGASPIKAPATGSFRSISKDVVATVIRLLLTKRRSPFFEKNMAIVIETVLYGINPDPFVERFRESFLREAGFFQGIQGYEYSRSFTGALENLQLGKLNRLLKDIRAVRGSKVEEKRSLEDPQALLFKSVITYCTERSTLTDRALRAVYNRFVRRRATRSREKMADMRMGESDFVRMYLALVGSGTDPGLKYWFSILDQDGDGWVGVSDVAHFYSERKLESENRNGIRLADAQCLWIRLCAMSGVSPRGKGLNLNALKELSCQDREFMMCALLIRRADDGNLINVAATVSDERERSRD